MYVAAVIDRKVACRSQGGETRPKRRAIDGFRLRVSSNAYSAYSYKLGTCVRFWRDRAANVCSASVNRCIFHINQLPTSRRPNLAWSESKFEKSMPNTHTQTTSRNLLLQTNICAAELATCGVGPLEMYTPQVREKCVHAMQRLPQRAVERFCTTLL